MLGAIAGDMIGSPYERETIKTTDQGSMPVALRAFLESRDWEEAVRPAVSMGGDSDTLACITGGIAEAFYGGVPDEIAARTLKLLGILGPPLLEVTDAFLAAYQKQ